MARVFAVMADFNALTECRGTKLGRRHKFVQVTRLDSGQRAQRSRCKTVPKPVNSPGVGFLLRAGERIRVYAHYELVTVQELSKNRDKLIDYTVRVMGQALFICLVTRKLSRYANIVFFIFKSWCRNSIATARGRKILKFLCYFASSLPKFWFRIGLCDFGNMLAKKLTL